MPRATITFTVDCEIQVLSPNSQGAIAMRFLRGDSVTGIVSIRMMQAHLGPTEACDVECEDGRVLLDVGIQCLRITEARSDSATLGSLAGGDDTMTGIEAVSVKEINHTGQIDHYERISTEPCETPNESGRAREHRARILAWLSSVFRIDRRCTCGQPCTGDYCQDCRDTFPPGTEPKVRYRKPLGLDELEVWQVND
jgi:hypothetical protein